MENKTSRVDFNTSSVKTSPIKTRHYSYKNVAHKLDLYSRFAKSKEQEKDMLDLKDNHFKGKISKDAKRGIGIQHFNQGHRVGFHTDGQKVNLETVHKEQDRQEHLKILNKGKKLYRHYSLSKRFDGARNAPSKNRDNEKGRINYI